MAYRLLVLVWVQHMLGWLDHVVLLSLATSSKSEKTFSILCSITEGVNPDTKSPSKSACTLHHAEPFHPAPHQQLSAWRPAAVAAEAGGVQPAAGV